MVDTRKDESRWFNTISHLLYTHNGKIQTFKKVKTIIITMERIIAKVRQSKSGQKTVTIPRNCELVQDDWVEVTMLTKE